MVVPVLLTSFSAVALVAMPVDSDGNFFGLGKLHQYSEKFWCHAFSCSFFISDHTNWNPSPTYSLTSFKGAVSSLRI